MKFINYILIMFFIVSCNKIKHKENPDIVVNANKIRSFDTITHWDSIKHKAFDIRLSIINKSEKPITFWIMTCSWDNNFIINNDYIQFLLWTCTNNIARSCRLGCNDSLVFKSTFVKYKGTMGQTIETTKFGFIYIDSTRCKNIKEYFDIMNDKSKQDKIIWSNPLYLKDTI